MSKVNHKAYTDCIYCGARDVNEAHLDECAEKLEDIVNHDSGEADDAGTAHGARWSILGWFFGFNEEADGGAD